MDPFFYSEFPELMNIGDLFFVYVKRAEYLNTKHFQKMTQWWRQILDLTYPMTSMFSGSDFNQTIKGTLNDTYIEDLWIPYFTVTTDITSSCMRIHTHGKTTFLYVSF